MRKFACYLTGLALIVFLAYSGQAAFRRWNQKKMMSSAYAYAQKGDLHSASLTARQVLQQDPSNIAMSRLMAQITDSVDSPEAIFWWSCVIKLEGEKFSSITRLVSAAMRAGENGVAEEALSQIGKADRETPGYHQLLAAYAVATRQLDLADIEFSAAAALEPQNESIRVNLAGVRLLSTRAETVAGARAVLEESLKKPEFRLQALRALLSDARKQGDTRRSLQMANDLAATPGCNIEDQLALLDEMRSGNRQDFEERLQGLKNAALRDPVLIQKLIRWMNARGMADTALEWMNTLDAKTRAQPAVQFAMAESLSNLQKWEELRSLLIRGNWFELDFMRLAIQARAARETMRSPEARSKWEGAILATRGGVRLLSMLARLVNSWDWKKEAVQVWWLIGTHENGQSAALKSLYKYYLAEKNTQQLCRVAERLYQTNPGNPAAKNNLAALSLLIGKNLERAHRLAAENYWDHPENPGVGSTYAFSLHLQRKTGEALKIMEGFPPESLREPSIAVYYGVLLAANGDPERAREYLEIAAKDDGLLEEEKDLFKQAPGL